MFSQVTKTSAIKKHSIHEETIGDLEHFALLWDLLSFLEHAVFDLRPDAVSSINELVGIYGRCVDCKLKFPTRRTTKNMQPEMDHS